jgi:endonuclease/exonuclease/phosphatase family metal-dependent hydrolase
VRSVLGGPSFHGLRHALVDRHGYRQEPTYLTHPHKGERWFDHILVSHEFQVADAGYRHDWRLARLSDHSAVWADLST